MEDSQIVELYWNRDESAIYETAAKYGRCCFAIAYNILHNREDAEESVNDTYISAWESMPPHRPSVLSAFLGKLTRRISINKLRDSMRIKRGGGETALVLDELSECIPSSQHIEQHIEFKELSQSINRFLGTLSADDRDVFICRYWFAASIREISSKFGFSESKTKSMLFRARDSLRKHLTKEGLI